MTRCMLRNRQELVTMACSARCEKGGRPDDGGDVSFPEVIAFEKEGETFADGQGVSNTVAEVQSGVATFAEVGKCLSGEMGLIHGKRLILNSRPPEKHLGLPACLRTELAVIVDELRVERGFRFTEQDCDQRGSVCDH